MSDFSPEDITRYRAGTDRLKSAAGITVPTFKCRKCKKSKTSVGRKPVVKGYSKAGYICKDCQQ